jgi:hypothetical protein
LIDSSQVDHAVRNKLDRIYVLDEKIQQEILDFLSEGNYLYVACEAAGTSYDCFHHWQRRWEDDDPVAQVFDNFFKAVKKAIALGEVNNLRTVTRGELGWQSAAWKLERRSHKRWGKKEIVVIQKGSDFDPSTMTDDELREIANARRKGKG